MRKAFILGALVILGACSDMSEKEQLKKNIADHKQQIRKLEQEVDKLETKLEKEYGSGAVKNKIAVNLKTVRYDTFRHFVRVNGKVEAVKNAFISPESNGRINDILVNEGEHVAKGELLVELNTSVTRNSIEEVKTSLELANEMFQKQKDLWNQNIGSEIEYLQARNRKESLEKKLETLQSQLEMARIRAPFSGIVDEILQKEGEMGMPGRQILRLVNLDKMEIEADVSEEYLSRIQKDDRVEVSFSAFPNLTRQLPISRIGNIIQPDSRTFTIEMFMDNPQHLIKPNLVAEVKINDFTADSALIVPSIIVKQDMKGSYVYRVVKKGESLIARKTYVETGESYNDNTMITEGLTVNDKVITAGYNVVSNGLEVSVKK
jgi:RND family efflux transporter MFP subunit